MLYKDNEIKRKKDKEYYHKHKNNPNYVEKRLSWRKKHKQGLKEYYKNYRKENKEELRDYMIKWREKNELKWVIEDSKLKSSPLVKAHTGGLLS